MSPTKLTAAVMLLSLMFTAGLQCNRANLVTALRNYGLIARALLANVVIVPLLGVLLVRLFHLNTYIAIGFLLMAMAPGAPFLPRAAGRQPGGSLGFAIALAFILPAVSIVTIPITAPLVLPTHGEGHVPLSQFLTSLIGLQLVPLLIGLVVADRAPAVAARLERPLIIVFSVAVAVLLALLGQTLVTGVASVYGSRGMLAMLVLVLLSLAAGWLLGGPQIAYRRTLGIGTAIRNIGLCALLASNFPGTLVGATVLTYLLIQFVVTLAFRAVMHRRATGTQAPA
jgi:bile acid:Na+ symporter, BASS family